MPDLAHFRDVGARVQALLLDAHNNIIEAGRLLFETRAQLHQSGKGAFGRWLDSEVGIKPAQAYRLIDAYKLSQSRPALDPATVGRSVFYLLAQVGTPDTAIDEVQGIIEEGAAVTVNEAKAIITVHKDVATVMNRWGVTNPETVGLLVELRRKGRETFEVVTNSGWVQVGDESDAVPITAAPDAIKRALGLKAAAHRQEAITNKPEPEPVRIIADVGGWRVVVRADVGALSLNEANALKTAFNALINQGRKERGDATG